MKVSDASRVRDSVGVGTRGSVMVRLRFRIKYSA